MRHFSTIVNDVFQNSYKTMIRTVECDETLAGTGLNVSHMMEGNQTDWKQSREAASSHLSNKKNGKDKIFSFVHSLVVVNFAAQTFLSGETPPLDPKKVNHTVCPTVTQGWTSITPVSEIRSVTPR